MPSAPSLKQAGPPDNDNEFLDALTVLRNSKRFPNPSPRRLAGDVRLKRQSASRAAFAPEPFTTRMSPGADAHRLAKSRQWVSHLHSALVLRSRRLQSQSPGVAQRTPGDGRRKVAVIAPRDEPLTFESRMVLKQSTRFGGRFITRSDDGDFDASTDRPTRAGILPGYGHAWTSRTGGALRDVPSRR